MGKNLFISNFRNFPKGFLLAIIFIGIFEISICFIPKHKLLTPPYEHAALEIKGEIVEQANSFDIIVLGDCMGWAAIKPLEIEKELQKKTFNLSVNGAQTYMMSYILLNRYLANCTRKPELVLLQISAGALLYLWGMNADALNNHILPWFRVDEDFLNELSVPLRSTCNKYKLLKFIPSLRNQFFLRKGFWPLRLIKSNKAEYERYMRYYREQQGFYNEDIDPTKKPVTELTDIEENFKQFIISDFNVTYIRKVLDVLNLQNIKVVICLTPVRKDEMLLWERYNLRSKLNEKIRELFCTYSNVLAFWDLQDIASDVHFFVDRYHVNEQGANVFTAELSRRIKTLICYPITSS